METHHVVLLAVLVVAAVGAYAIFASPATTGMATNSNPWQCTAWGGYWYSPYGCKMTQALCRNAGGTWRVKENQCVNYDPAELCDMIGSTYDSSLGDCRY